MNLAARCPGISVAVEPRHASWFTEDAGQLLVDLGLSRVAADPAVVPSASEPGGNPDLTYLRLHGSPRIYYSAYEQRYLDDVVWRIKYSLSRKVWCVFDNTALGHATANALYVLERTRPLFRQRSFEASAP